MNLTRYVCSFFFGLPVSFAPLSFSPYKYPDSDCTQNPEYIIIKRWVPPEEQKELWSLTRIIRDERVTTKTKISIEDRSRHHSHHRHRSGDGLVMVRSTKRERSRSPSVSVLSYLAGAR